LPLNNLEIMSLAVIQLMNGTDWLQSFFFSNFLFFLGTDSKPQMRHGTFAKPIFQTNQLYV